MSSPSSRYFYDLAEVLIPGGFFVGCLMVIYHHPATQKLDNWTLGALGVYLLISFAAGHLVQTLSNTIEMYWWRSVGGMPHDWVRSGRRQLLPPAKVLELERHVRVKLQQPAGFTIGALDSGGWYFLLRQMAALVAEYRPEQRATYLESGYNINRGLSCAVFAMAAIFLLNDPFADPTTISDTDFSRICMGVVIFMVGVLTLFRMQRFSVQYSLELFAQFMLLPMPRGSERQGTRELDPETAKLIERGPQEVAT